MNPCRGQYPFKYEGVTWWVYIQPEHRDGPDIRVTLRAAPGLPSDDAYDRTRYRWRQHISGAIESANRETSEYSGWSVMSEPLTYAVIEALGGVVARGGSL